MCEEQCRSHDERTCIRQRHALPFHSTERIGDTTTGVVHCRRKSEERPINMFRVAACLITRQRLTTGLHWRTSGIPSHCMTLMLYLHSTRLTEVCFSGRTEKLCVQYFKIVATIRLFIRSERCGDWQLHVHSV